MDGETEEKLEGKEKEKQESDTEEAVSEVERLKQEILTLKESDQENYNRYLRSLADLDNQKKRFYRQIDQEKKYALESFFKDVLPVLDSFDKAFKAETVKEGNHSEASEFNQGITLVSKQLAAVLEKHGPVVAKINLINLL